MRGVQPGEHAKALAPLAVGDCVQVQNQTGPHKLKWDVSGTIVEYLGHDAYLVKLDGSGRVSKRNRRILKRIIPFTSVIKDTERVAQGSQPQRINVDDQSNTIDSGPKLSSGMLRVGPDVPVGTGLSGGSMHSGARLPAVPPSGGQASDYSTSTGVHNCQQGPVAAVRRTASTCVEPVRQPASKPGAVRRTASTGVQ